ncbi:MAG: CPBP family intramembrane glutamate endopeptidase, partial [Cyanobacteriota bacterium]|nr:CPBP family intramembrane glutamate endopeptidase [Cyanobacteriota bacterium]
MYKSKLSIKGRLRKTRKLRFKIFVIILIICTSLGFLQALLASQPSNYSIHSQQSFNQPNYYPLTQTVNPNLYQPVGNWVGRLILPKPEINSDSNSDWVWFEVQHAPSSAKNLVGKVVRLEWQNQPELQSYVKAVTRDVNFTPATFKSQKQGNIHPQRLNKLSQITPLQSLAGARPNDNVIVTLSDTEIVEANNQQILQINQEPVLTTGRFYALVDIESNDKQFFQVRHYNPDSGDFINGEQETIYIPKQVADTRNIPPSTTNKLPESTVTQGWYIYGAKNKSGIFTVQALAPRSLFQLQPDHIILNPQTAQNYLKKYWEINPEDKGKLTRTVIDPTSTESEYPVSKWREGDKAIILNVFGGIGGEKAETLGVPQTITGHFAFGIAEIIRSPFTKELEFDIKYHQIYAHNPAGIISGTHTWSNYMGNLQSGWLYTRPVTDILVKFPPVTQDYIFDNITISPLTEFERQLQIMMARYRVGDGTGNSTVTPATSCIQDSSQALYAAIEIIKQKIKSNPKIQDWLQTHPKHPQTLRFQQLGKLSLALQKQLLPLGIVRSDWQNSVDILAGIGDTKTFTDTSIWAALTSWRTMMPRQAQDELAALFWKQKAKLWFLQTYQVGGLNPEITPLAPTPLLGQIKLPFTNVPIISIILNRILASAFIPNLHHWLIAFL